MKILSEKQIEEFLTKLDKACNFRYKIKNDPKSVTWKCGGDFKFSEQILNEMEIPKITQTKFLNYCKKNGGYCDCEILFNVEQKLWTTK